MLVSDHQGKAIRLGVELGKGGEGVVFAIEGDSARVAKLYLPSIEVQARIPKLEAMVEQYSDDIAQVAAWPESLLIDPTSKKVLGFTMPRVNGYRDLHELYSPVHRRRHFPAADWSFLVHVAMNTAAVFELIHSKGHAIGDVNAKNIRVSERGLVKLVDCDSFAIAFRGVTFPCLVGVAEFTPPELQKIPFSKVSRTPDHDNFGLALIVFHLLFLGRHPYVGVPTDHQAMISIGTSIREQRFAFGARASTRGLSPPPMALPLDAVPSAIADLFERAFVRSAMHQPRPSAAEWRGALRLMSNSLLSCQAETTHKYPSHLAECPWCALVEKVHVDYFPGANIRVVEFKWSPSDVLPFWQELERYRSFNVPALPAQTYAPLGATPANVISTRARHRHLAHQYLISAWVLAASAVPTLLTPFGWVPVALAAAATIINAGRLRFAKRRTLLEAESRRLEGKARDAKDAYTATERRMMAAQSAVNSRLSSIAATAQRAKDAYLGLRARHDARLAELERDKRKAQLAEHLRTALIDDAQIEKVGPGRKKSLAAYGIETAYDVLSSDFSSIPGVGPAIRENITAWARGIEQKFVFDSRKGVSDLERHNATLITRREQTTLRSTLETAAKAAKTAFEEATLAVQPLLAEAKTHQEEWSKLKAAADAQVTAAIDDDALAPVSLAGRVAFVELAKDARRETGIAQAELAATLTNYREHIVGYARARHTIVRRTIETRSAPGAGGPPGRPPSASGLAPWSVSPAQLPQTSQVTCQCTTCSGAGQSVCSRCSGTTRERCRACRGRGLVSSDRRPYTKNCPSCKGRGDQRCTTCSSGKVSCDDCNGTGQTSSWLEVVETRQTLVRTDPPDADRFHSNVRDPQDFEAANAFSPNQLVYDSASTNRPQAIPASLAPSVDARYERVENSRVQSFEATVHEFDYAAAGRSARLTAVGVPPKGSSASDFRPLYRHRSIVRVATAVTTAILVACLVIFGTWSPNSSLALTSGAALLGGIAVIGARGAIAGALLGKRGRRNVGPRVSLSLSAFGIVCCLSLLLAARQNQDTSAPNHAPSTATPSGSREVTSPTSSAAQGDAQHTSREADTTGASGGASKPSTRLVRGTRCGAEGACKPGWTCSRNTDFCERSAQLVELKADIAVRASSALPDDSQGTYQASNMLDGRLDTAWQPSAPRTRGVGQSFTMTLKKRQLVASVSVANGFQHQLNGSDLFVQHDRIRSAEITVGQSKKEFGFPEDERGYIEIPIDPPALASTIRIKVVSVWEGSDRRSLAVSEVKLYTLDE